MNKALLPLLALALTAGCMVTERPYDNMQLDPDRFAAPINFTNNLGDGVRPLNGRLAGDMGPSMRAMDDVAELNGYHDVGYTNLEVVVSNDRGSAMALLDFMGGIDHPSLEPGASFTFTNDDNRGEASDLNVSALACSGDQGYGQWDYDMPAERVDLDVEATDNPEVKRLSFTTYQDGDIATGYVDVVAGD